jgi:lipopolysaccharide transport system ATP-binding protein
LTVPAIRVRNLGKRYQLGARERGYTTLREALVRVAKAPFHRFRRLSGCSSSSESFWALKNVSFDIGEGEVVGIIGRNGAGKSTLLKILSQITEPSAGEVELHGRVGSLLEVGTGFHPELTGRENIYLNGAILGMKRHEIARKFDEIVAFAEVEEFLDTPVKRYSSGMYVRLAFSVAAHLEPETLIIDEVLAVGDTGFQQRCLAKMRDAARSGKTIIIVSHQVRTLESLCSSCILIDKGSLIERGKPDSVILSYLNSLKVSRSPTQRPERIIKSVVVNEKPSDETVILRINDPIKVELELDTTDCQDDLVCGIVILDESSTRVASLHSLYQSNIAFAPGRRHRTKCEVRSLPLVPGTYFLEINVGNGTRTVDSFPMAARVEVHFRDVFNTGCSPDRSQGPLVLACEWALK